MNEGSSGNKLTNEGACVYRNTVVNLNYWAQDRPDLQHTVRICSKFVANPTARDWMRVKRIGRYAEGCPNIGNSGWAGDQVTRKRVSQRNTSFGESSLAKLEKGPKVSLRWALEKQKSWQQAWQP